MMVRTKPKIRIAYAALALFASPAFSQTQTNTSTTKTVSEAQPLYRVTVVSRSTKSINYRHRSGSTKVDFQGTAIMPQSEGEARVESERGNIRMNVSTKKMDPPSKFGPEYLTFVLWAITPEGRAQNMGELILEGDRAKIATTTDLQAFGMIVTAEPYFGVTVPSDVVVMENFVRGDTKGRVEVIDAKYELLQRGSYTFRANESASKVSGDDPRTPAELIQARNAVQISRWAGSDKYATDVYEKANTLLKQAEDYKTRKQWKPSAMIARQAVTTAEDARLIALRRIEEERLANERRMAAEREAKAKAEAEEADRQQQLEAKRRAQAELEAAASEKARLQAEQERIAADRAKMEAEMAQKAALAQQQAAQAAAEAARLQSAENQRLAAEAERLRASADAARLTAEQEKEALRRRLLEQFSAILETRDTARGLIVNLSDVLFDTGKYTLRPLAREKLARFSGIVLAHPGLRIEAEGHTDSVGGEAYNQRLSEQRADSARNFLLSNGVRGENLTAKGFGKTSPIADNSTAAGRQQNRRVELVVSGEIIGTKISDLSKPAPTPMAPAGTVAPQQ